MEHGKTFNMTADCKPNLYYMVDIGSRLAEIKKYVDKELVESVV